MAHTLAYATFDAYVADFPEAERLRHWIARGNRSVVIVAGSGPHGSLPGGYLWATTARDGTVVWVNDNDDGYLVKECESALAAEGELVILMALAPFELHELMAFGYHVE